MFKFGFLSPKTCLILAAFSFFLTLYVFDITTASGVVTHNRVINQRPHIIYILVDDLGWADVGYQGAEYPTKYIDALAYSGLIFNYHYANHACSPTRVALMTGRVASVEVGVNLPVFYAGTSGMPPQSHHFLSQKMKNHGYNTHMIGKWHLGFARYDDMPLQRGFDTFLGSLCPRSTYFTHRKATKVLYRNCDGAPYKYKKDDELSSEWGDCLYNGNTPLGSSRKGEYQTTIYNERIVEIINGYQHGDPPLFAFLAHQAVHNPYQAPNSYVKSAACSKLSGSRAIYCGMVQSIDEGISQTLEALKNNDMLQNTIIIFTSDNGGPLANDPGRMDSNAVQVASNAPLRGGKCTWFEGGNRVPAFIWGSAIRPDSVDLLHKHLKQGPSDPDPISVVYNGLFHIRDWFLTIQAMSGAAVDNKFVSPRTKDDATPLVSSYNHWPQFVKREAVVLRDTMVFDIIRDSAAIRNKHYKLIKCGWTQDWRSSSKVPRACLGIAECEGTLLFKISEDESESRPLDLTKLDGESLQNYESLQDELERWSEIAVQPLSPTEFMIDINVNMQGIPRYSNCRYAPYVSTKNHKVTVLESCEDSEGIECTSENETDWMFYAG